MTDALIALGAALLAAGVLARLGRRYQLPTIPLFMLAGVVFGPHTPGVALVRTHGELELVATLGLVLLLFYLGLEFSTRDLVEGGRKLFAAGALCLGLNVTAGLTLGFALGWGTREALVVTGAVAISSSAIATKLLVELHRIANPESRVILGIIIVEDLFLAGYLALLQPVLAEAHGTLETIGSIAKAFGFLLLLAIVARKGTRLVGRLMDTDDDELLTVCFVGLTVLIAGVALELGVSDAIGAFMVGLILVESPARRRIQQLVLPLRDTFAALFFFTVGVSIDPSEIASVAGPIAAAVALSFVVNLAAGFLVARLQRLGRVAGTNIGLTVLARLEFSLILASLAASAALDERVAPFIAGYVFILALAAPLLTAHSGALSRLIPATRRSRRKEEVSHEPDTHSVTVSSDQEEG